MSYLISIHSPCPSLDWPLLLADLGRLFLAPFIFLLLFWVQQGLFFFQGFFVLINTSLQEVEATHLQRARSALRHLGVAHHNHVLTLMEQAQSSMILLRTDFFDTITTD